MLLPGTGISIERMLGSCGGVSRKIGIGAPPPITSCKNNNVVEGMRTNSLSKRIAKCNQQPSSFDGMFVATQVLDTAEPSVKRCSPETAPLSSQTTTSTHTFHSHSPSNNFFWYSFLFSLNHSTGLACLALATVSLGSDKGSAQTGILYAAYTTTAAFFASYVVSRLGSKMTSILGMALFCFYVGSCYFAVLWSQSSDAVVYLGAVIGGCGAGLAWTAQGTYFAQTVEAGPDGSTRLAAVFACMILVLETVVEGMSTVLVHYGGVPWSFVFAVYAFLAVISTIAMFRVQSFPHNSRNAGSLANQGTAALQLFVEDSRMKYLIGFNAVYGFSGAFLNSFISGEVVPIVSNKSLVGVLAASHGVAAAGASVCFGWLTSRNGRSEMKFWKIGVLAFGSLCFSLVAVPFLLNPSLETWSWPTLVMVYIVEGAGRASAEGTLKAVFADYFSYEKEGAFAAIILQYGSLSSLAYFLANRFLCSSYESSTGCIRYRDGSVHDVRSFAIIVVLAGAFSIVCLVRVSFLDYGSRRMSRSNGVPRYDAVKNTELSTGQVFT